MRMLFEYNWQVREDWFDWCENLSEEELLLPRTGGVGSIVHTLFHIVDVEQLWVRELASLPELEYHFEAFASLPHVRAFSAARHEDIRNVLDYWNPEWETRILRGVKSNGQPYEHTYGEVLRHTIAHEIHHIGQLSVWAREMGLKPVSANLIGRNLASRV